MIKKILKLVFNKETILYIIFGLLTTLIYGAVFKVFFENIWYSKKEMWVAAQAVAWVISVIFAFIVNKIFVFESKEKDAATLRKETLLFLIARVLTQGLQYAVTASMILFLPTTKIIIPSFKIIGLEELAPETLATYIGQVLVIIANYFLSKLFIFNKKPEKE